MKRWRKMAGEEQTNAAGAEVWRCWRLLSADPADFSLSLRGRAPQPLHGSQPHPAQPRHFFFNAHTGAFTVRFAFSLFYVLP